MKIDAIDQSHSIMKQEPTFAKNLVFRMTRLLLAGISTWPGEEKMLIESGSFLTPGENKYQITDHSKARRTEA